MYIEVVNISDSDLKMALASNFVPTALEFPRQARVTFDTQDMPHSLVFPLISFLEEKIRSGELDPIRYRWGGLGISPNTESFIELLTSIRDEDLGDLRTRNREMESEFFGRDSS